MTRGALLAVAVLLALAGFAEAKRAVGTPPRKGQNASPDYRSAQWFAFELKFSPYSPKIDESPGLTGTPFADLFTKQTEHGRPPARLLTQLELDFQFLHKVGSLGVGATVGYYRRSTHAFQAEGGASCVVPSCVRSGDQTALNVIPLSLLLVYRFDYLAERWRVPLVPYVKIGLAYYIWVIQNGAGGVPVYTNADGTTSDGYGGTFGWVVNPGLALQLDVLDRSAARTMDAELGINHSYLFVELHHADISGFGAKNRLTLSDTTLNAGLAFEF